MIYIYHYIVHMINDTLCPALMLFPSLTFFLCYLLQRGRYHRHPNVILVTDQGIGERRLVDEGLETGHQTLPLQAKG